MDQIKVSFSSFGEHTCRKRKFYQTKEKDVWDEKTVVTLSKPLYRVPKGFRAPGIQGSIAATLRLRAPLLTSRLCSKHRRNDRALGSTAKKSRAPGTPPPPSFWDPVFKDGADYCYCAFILHISRYLGFLSVVLTNAGIFLSGLKLRIESRT